MSFELSSADANESVGMHQSRAVHWTAAALRREPQASSSCIRGQRPAGCFPNTDRYRRRTCLMLHHGGAGCWGRSVRHSLCRAGGRGNNRRVRRRRAAEGVTDLARAVFHPVPGESDCWCGLALLAVRRDDRLKWTVTTRPAKQLQSADDVLNLVRKVKRPSCVFRLVRINEYAPGQWIVHTGLSKIKINARRSKIESLRENCHFTVTCPEML